MISLPDCPKCDEIKRFLTEKCIPYTEKTLNSEIQTDLVMKDIYFDPPILVIGNKHFSYKNFKNSPSDILAEVNECIN